MHIRGLCYGGNNNRSTIIIIKIIIIPACQSLRGDSTHSECQHKAQHSSVAGLDIFHSIIVIIIIFLDINILIVILLGIGLS